MGGQAHPAPFPSGARPPARPSPPPKCPAFPCSLRSPSGALWPPPGLLNQFSEAEGQKVERKRKGGKPRWPRHRTQNGGGQTSRERGETLDDPHFGPQFHPKNFTSAILPTAGRPPWSGRSPRRHSVTASKRRPPHFRPPPPASLFRPSPDSALETTSPTYPLLLQIPCRATVTPTPVLERSVVKWKKSFAWGSARNNGSSNRLRRWQPLRELRSRATGLGGWERASEKEGVGREQRRPACQLSRDLWFAPALALAARSALARWWADQFVGGRGGERLRGSLVRRTDYCKTVKCLEFTFLLIRGGCEVVVTASVCWRNHGVAVWKSFPVLCLRQNQIR